MADYAPHDWEIQYISLRRIPYEAKDSKKPVDSFYGNVMRQSAVLVAGAGIGGLSVAARLVAVVSIFPLAQVSFEHAANWGIPEQERAPMLS